MVGLKRGTVKLVRYNPKWRQSFQHEQKKLSKVFGRDVLEIQHVGSTAIPGILAKPIIDIALIVPSLQKARRYEKKLKEIGYEIKKNDTRKERLFFAKGSENKRTHYLHVGEIGSGYTEDMILFRDYLCKRKDIAKKYSGLKERLAEKYQDAREIYAVKKEKLIKEIIKKAKKSLRTQE
ncbi:MAG: GrpB family protein [Patescibacteria group bacterium]